MSSPVEAPRNLIEQMAWEAVEQGNVAPRDESEVDWRGPTREPFLSLWARGWRKWKARFETSAGRVVVIHFWRAPDGERRYLKIKSV